MTYDDLVSSLAVLGLGSRATLKEIRDRHRQLAKRFHPDAADGGDPDHMRRINEAYRVVSHYVSSYVFDFSADEFYEQNPEERMRDQFFTDPWGYK